MQAAMQKVEPLILEQMRGFLAASQELEAAVRRSELVALDITDLDFIDDDLVIMLKRSKTHQEGEGRKVG